MEFYNSHSLDISLIGGDSNIEYLNMKGKKSCTFSLQVEKIQASDFSCGPLNFSVTVLLDGPGVSNSYGSFTLPETDSGTDSDSEDSCPVQKLGV